MGVEDSQRLEFTVLRVAAKGIGALPWGLGQFRLASRYAVKGRWQSGSTVVQQMRSGARISLDLGDRAQMIAFLVRDYSPEITEYIAERLPAGGTLFDVGAHIGLISFSIAARRPDVLIHGFEPNPANAQAWRFNRQLNRAMSAELTEAGVSDRNGEMTFGMPGDSGSGELGRDGMSVSVTSLDSYCAAGGIDRIDVLKVDVQGHELAVIEGAERLLCAGAIQTVICEVDISDAGAIMEILRPHGFRPVEIPNVGMRRFRRSRTGCDLAFER